MPTLNDFLFPYCGAELETRWCEKAPGGSFCLHFHLEIKLLKRSKGEVTPGDKGRHHLPTRLLKNGEGLSAAARGSGELRDPGDQDPPQLAGAAQGWLRVAPRSSEEASISLSFWAVSLKMKNPKGPGSGARFGWEMMARECSVLGKMGIFGE